MNQTFSPRVPSVTQTIHAPGTGAARNYRVSLSPNRVSLGEVKSQHSGYSIPEESSPLNRALPDLLLFTQYQASPRGVTTQPTSSSQRSLVHRIGLCPKLWLNHIKYGLLPTTITYMSSLSFVLYFPIRRDGWCLRGLPDIIHN